MTGLEYKDRTDDSVHLLEVAGAFVQIGLLPNTNWLGDTVARNRMGKSRLMHVTKPVLKVFCCR